MTHLDPYHAIADPNRRTIIDLLQRHGSLRAGDIVAQLPHISQPAVSKHLRVLRQANLVYDISEGRERWYHFNPQPLREVMLWLRHNERVWDQRLATLKDVVEQQAQVDMAQSARNQAGDDRSSGGSDDGRQRGELMTGKGAEHD